MDGTSDGQHIQEEMAALRREVQADVDAILEDARTLTDWRFYLRSYPLPCLALAGAVGYFLVPKRPRVISADAKTLAELAAKNRLVLVPKAAPPVHSALGTTLLHLLANGAMRAALASLGHPGNPAAQAPQDRNAANAGETLGEALAR